MKKVTLTAAHPAILALCGITLEAGKDSAEVEMNEELMGKINSALLAGTTAVADLNTAKTNLETANEKLTTAEKDLKESGDKLTKLQGEYDTLATSNAGATGTKKEGDEDTTSGKDSDKEVWDVAHNKAVMNDPLYS